MEQRRPGVSALCLLLALLLAQPAACFAAFAGPRQHHHHHQLHHTSSNTKKPARGDGHLTARHSARVLRGGSMTAGVVSDALTLMGQTITPSALLAGASLTALTNMEADDTPPTRRIKALNILCAYTAYGLQLASVVGSSMTCMQLLAGGFNADAKTGVALLLREFELNFLTVQLCFGLGVLFFLATIITRTYVVYSSESERFLSNGIVGVLGLVSMIILRMLCEPIIGVPSTHARLLRYLHLLWQRVLFRPLTALGVAAWVALLMHSNTREMQQDTRRSRVFAGFKNMFQGSPVEDLGDAKSD